LAQSLGRRASRIAPQQLHGGGEAALLADRPRPRYGGIGIRAEPAAAPQFSQLGSCRARRPALLVERRVEPVQDGGFGVAEPVGVGYGDGDDAQVGAGPC
jgi:hypothetical protein